jgi:hypothetical protein
MPWHTYIGIHFLYDDITVLPMRGHVRSQVVVRFDASPERDFTLYSPTALTEILIDLCENYEFTAANTL